MAEVIVVGGGPAGLTAANLLGRAGLGVVVLEREPGTSDFPKAVSFDDESLRTFQRAGLVPEMYAIVQPGTGTKYYGANGKVMAYGRGVQPPRLGHSVKNAFQQPVFEAVLAAAAQDLPNVQIRHGNLVVGLEQRSDHVLVRSVTPEGDESVSSARYVLGCDGGTSTVRNLLSIDLDGSSFAQQWIVIDTVNDPHHERFAMHHGDPIRPHVIISGRDGFCRYEFLLHPHESFPSDDVPFDLVRDLLAPYRSIWEDEVLRRTTYTFHGLVATRWGDGRVFLAGDAAHMMPPFAGQGLNSGIRDVDNLSWKLVECLRNGSGHALLATYEAERRPHAEATVRFSARMGSIVMTTSRWRAWLRDVCVRTASALPGTRRYIREMRFRPQVRHRTGFVWYSGDRHVDRLVGTMLPQPYVLLSDGARVLLDDVLGSGFAVLTLAPDDRTKALLDDELWARPGWRRLDLYLDDRFARDRPGVVGIADADGILSAELGHAGGRVVVVRPDRYIAAFVRQSDLVAFAEWLQHWKP